MKIVARNDVTTGASPSISLCLSENSSAKPMSINLSRKKKKMSHLKAKLFKPEM